jgi:prophage regulatory protein
METESLLRLPQVQNRTGLSRSAIYQRVREGTFPPPIKLGERASAWQETAVALWISQRIAASNAARAA